MLLLLLLMLLLLLLLLLLHLKRYVITWLNDRLPFPEPYTIYEIWVRAIVNGEETDESDHITANTDVGRPSAPRVTNATCYANNSVYVEWRRPESFHKAVDYYMLYYKREGEQTFEATHLEAGQKEVRRVSESRPGVVCVML